MCISRFCLLVLFCALSSWEKAEVNVVKAEYLEVDYHYLVHIFLPLTEKCTS